MADPKTQLLISLPGGGQTSRYQLAEDTPIKFDFDIAEAEFTGQDGNLVIAIEGGGTIILEGYEALAESGTLPTFELMNGEQVAGDVYIFAFGEGDQTAEDIETAADGAANGSGAGEYSDDAGSLGDGIDALGGQGDAFAALAAAPGADLEGNTAPIANDDFNEITEQGDVDLYVNLEDPNSHITQVQSQTVTFNPEFDEPQYPGDDGQENQMPRFLGALADSGENVGSIDPDTGEIYVESMGMTISAHSSYGDQDNDALVIGDDGLGVDNNGTNWGDNPAIDDFGPNESVQLSFDDPQGFFQLTLGGFNEGYEFNDDATITLYGENGVIDTIHLGMFSDGTFEYTVKAGEDLITSVEISAGGQYDHQNNDFYIESITTTAVPEGDFFPTDELGNGFIVNYPEGEHSFQDVTGNVIANDFDAETPDQLAMRTIDFIGENHDGVDEPGVEMTTDGTEVQGLYGILTIDLDGEYTYTLNPDWADHLEEGQIVEEVFQYTIEDPEGAVSNVAELTISVFGTNDAPVAVADFDNEAIEQGDSEGYVLPDDYSTGDDVPGDDVPGDDLYLQRVDEKPGQGDDGLHDYTEMVVATGNVLLNDSDVDDLDFTDPDNPDTPDVTEGDFSTLFVVGVYSNETMEYDWREPGDDGTEYDEVPTEDGQVYDIATPGGSVEVVGKYGTLHINADGSYEYAPDVEENVAPLNYDNPGVETFTYAIMDDSGAFSYDTITFKVNGANDAPDVEADTNSMLEQGARGCPPGWAFGNVLANDSDIDDTHIFVENISSGTGAEASIVDGGWTSIAGQYGTLYIYSNGHYSYQLDQDNPAVEDLNVYDDGSFETLDEVFTYSATNSWDDGVSSETTLTITIHGNNDAPVANPDVPAYAYVSDFSDAAGEASFAAFGMTFIPLVADLHESANLTFVPGKGLGVRDWGDSSPAIDNSGDVNGVEIQFDAPVDTTTINLSSVDFADDMFIRIVFADGSSQRFTLHQGDIDFDAQGNAQLVFDYDLDMSSITLWTTIEPYDSDSFYIKSVMTTPGEVDATGVHAVEAGDHHDDLIDMDGPDVAATLVAGNLLANDTDVDDADFSDGNGETDLSVVGAGFGDGFHDLGWFNGATTIQGTYGTLTISEDGEFTYNPNSADANALNNGDVVTDTFVYAISDNHEGGGNPYGQEAYDWSTLTVTVEGTNDAPVANCDWQHSQVLGISSVTASAQNGFDVEGMTFTALSSYNGEAVEAELHYTSRGLGVDNNMDWNDSGAVDNRGADDAVKIDFDLAQSSVTIELSAYNSYYDHGNDDVQFVIYDMNGNEITTLSRGRSFDGDITIDMSDTGNVPIGSIVVQTPTGGSNDDFLIASVEAEAIHLGGAANATEATTYSDGETSGGIDVAGNVLANDTDVDNIDFGDGDGSATELSVVGVENNDGQAGTEANGVFTIQGEYGTLTIQANGFYTYELNQEDPKVQALDDDSWPKFDKFEYTISDNESDAELHDTSHLVFKVIGANDAPEAVDDLITDTIGVTNTFQASEVEFASGSQSAFMDGITVTGYVDNDPMPWTTGNSYNPDLAFKTIEGHTGIGINSWNDIEDAEVDGTNNWGMDESLVVSFDDPALAVTIQLGAFFADSGYDGGRTEYANATAWGYNNYGHLVQLQTIQVHGESDGLVEFTLDGGSYEIAKVVLTPVDNGAGSNGNNSDFILVSVEASNEVPIYEGQAEPVIIQIADILANDFDIDGGKFTGEEPDFDGIINKDGYVITDEGVSIEVNGGTAIIDGDRILFYLDDDTNNENGDTSFDYQVTDGDLTDRANVSLDVQPVNDAPVAIDDPNIGIFVSEYTTETPVYGWLESDTGSVDFDNWSPHHWDGPGTWQNEANAEGVQVLANYGTLVHEDQGMGVHSDGYWFFGGTTDPSNEISSGNSWGFPYGDTSYEEAVTISFGNAGTELPRDVVLQLGELTSGETATVTVTYIDVDTNGTSTETYTVGYTSANDDSSSITLYGVQGNGASATGQKLIKSITLDPGNTASSFTLEAITLVAASEWGQIDTELTHHTEVSGTVEGYALHNDFDVDNDASDLTATLVDGNGMYGTLVITDPNTGEYTYTPDHDLIFGDSGLSGSYVEEFTYEVSDGAGGTDTGTILVPIHYNANVVDSAVNGEMIGTSVTADDSGADVMHLTADTNSVILGDGADMIVVDSDYINASTQDVTVSGFEGDDTLILNDLFGQSVTFSEAADGDLQLTINDIDGDVQITLDGYQLTGVEQSTVIGTTVDIDSNSESLDSLIQTIINSPDHQGNN